MTIQDSMIGIYILKNKITGKVYIGQSIDIEARYKQHLKSYNNRNLALYSYPLYVAMRKYGVGAFEFKVLEECSQQELNEKEIYYIKKYNSCVHFKNSNGYNLTIGDNSGSHYDVNEIRALWNDGLCLSEIAERVGCHHGTVKRILSKMPEYNRLESVRRANQYGISYPVYQYDLQGNYLTTFRSAVEAGIAVGISAACIRACLYGKTKYAAGSQWTSIKFDKIDPIEKYLPHTRRVAKLSIDGERLAVYSSISEAARENMIQKSSNISLVCQGKRNVCGGFKWKYID